MPVSYTHLRLCAKVYVTIIMDEREDPYKKAIPHQLFAMSRQLVQQLMKAADEAGCPVEPEIWVKRSVHGRFLPGSRMDQLEQNLFRYGKRRIAGKEAGRRTASKAEAGTNGKNKKEIGPSTLENTQETKTEHLESGQDLKQQGIYLSLIHICARVEAAVYRSAGQSEQLPWGGAIR